MSWTLKYFLVIIEAVFFLSIADILKHTNAFEFHGSARLVSNYGNVLLRTLFVRRTVLFKSSFQIHDIFNLFISAKFRYEKLK
jgi:hypothetical protein